MGIFDELIYAHYVYEIVSRETKGLDAVYEDYIDYLVGASGLAALKEHKMLETCGMVNGRQLYALVSREEHSPL